MHCGMGTSLIQDESDVFSLVPLPIILFLHHECWGSLLSWSQVPILWYNDFVKTINEGFEWEMLATTNWRSTSFWFVVYSVHSHHHSYGGSVTFRHSSGEIWRKTVKRWCTFVNRKASNHLKILHFPPKKKGCLLIFFLPPQERNSAVTWLQLVWHWSQGCAFDTWERQSVTLTRILLWTNVSITHFVMIPGWPISDQVWLESIFCI